MNNKTTYYQRNREKILNRAKDTMKIKKILREQVRNKYTEWSDEEKNIKREYGRDRYHNMSNLKKKCR